MKVSVLLGCPFCLLREFDHALLLKELVALSLVSLTIHRILEVVKHDYLILSDQFSTISAPAGRMPSVF